MKPNDSRIDSSCLGNDRGGFSSNCNEWKRSNDKLYYLKQDARNQVPGVIPSLECLIKKAIQRINYRRRFHLYNVKYDRSKNDSSFSKRSSLPITQTDIESEIRRMCPLVDEWYSGYNDGIDWIKKIPMTLLLVKSDLSESSESSDSKYAPDAGLQLLRKNSSTQDICQMDKNSSISSLPSLYAFSLSLRNSNTDHPHSHTFSQFSNSDVSPWPDKPSGVASNVHDSKYHSVIPVNDRESFERMKAESVDAFAEASLMRKSFWSNSCFIDVPTYGLKRPINQEGNSSQDLSSEKTLRRVTLAVDESGKAVIKLVEPSKPPQGVVNHPMFNSAAGTVRGSGIGMKKLISSRSRNFFGQ